MACERFARACAALLVLAVGRGEARAQDGSADGPSTQIWANVTLGKTVSARTYLELDIEPKWQVTSGGEWRNLDLTPLAEYSDGLARPGSRGHPRNHSPARRARHARADAAHRGQAASLREDGPLPPRSPRPRQYAIADAEYYAPLGDDIPERYVNKVRARLGLGYRVSGATRLEFLYIRDWNRDSPEEEGTEDTQALDLRVKLLF